MIRFKLSDNEEEYKKLYFDEQNKNFYVYIQGYSYYLLPSEEKRFLFFSPNRDLRYDDNNYNNLLYKISKEFGEWCINEKLYTFPDKYLVQLNTNYYLSVEYDERLLSCYSKDKLCYIVYIDNEKIVYDTDFFEFNTLTARKLSGFLPRNTSLRYVQKQLSLLQNKINSLLLLKKIGEN